ncbi:MAG: type IIA DNA topoisomerase subunit B [Lentisphaerae bacterium]|jgi:DNA gyrase subunit B/topoisomerase-4 subunit B|nr:type IIA DNA topoisomerase subunit B [Lentisphaerota bacterium]
MSKAYDERHIQTLSDVEHIRMRSGMYIGRTGDGSQYEDGIYILLKEVIDNAVDEFIMGFGRKIDISLNYETGEVSVRDYGRGIPLGSVVDCVSRKNTGGKFNDDVFQFSVGMNGVGTKAVNALSTDFEVRSFRDGEFSEAFFSKGKLISQKRGKCGKPERNGTYVRFTPDGEIFKNYKFREEHVARRMRMYAYLNAELVIDVNGEKFVSENGLLDLINDEAQFERLYTPFHYRSKTLELVFTHTNRFSEDYYSFVNGQFTNDGGTHLSAFREGLLKAVNEFSKKRFDGDDVREGVVGAVAIRLKDPIFESQTKNRLGNTEIRSDLVNEVRRVIVEMLHREPEEAAKLVNKIDETSKLRAELNQVKKLARERSRAVSVRVPQLKDCKRHLNMQRGTGLDSMIFITEGLSAAGSITSSRDVNTQAVFTLRGKPLNVCDLKRDAIYKNVELYNLMQSLDIEDTVDHLRYQKVILATDADVDGLHIRNLMITFFARFFDRVIREGHLYILETPLFRVRNKKETIYCYSEDERVAAIEKCGGRQAEITRFKGLGEIDPSEFKHFIGPSMRLTPVDSSRDHGIGETLSFYMGRNTPERREYIMDNLVITEDALA